MSPEINLYTKIPFRIFLRESRDTRYDLKGPLETFFMRLVILFSPTTPYLGLRQKIQTVCLIEPSSNVDLDSSKLGNLDLIFEQRQRSIYSTDWPNFFKI